MNKNIISIIPAVPGQHFEAIARLMNTVDSEPNTATSLLEWYNKQMEDGVQINAAITGKGSVLGFSLYYMANKNRAGYYGIYNVVDEAWRDCGLGSLLYDGLLAQLWNVGGQTVKARVRDNCTEGIRFAERRGFELKKHSVEMLLDLAKWDDSRYEPILEDLRSQGFRFTNMAELGDGEEERRKLYALNNDAAATDPGSDGIPPWASFEEFNRDVCGSSWYYPDAQIVAVDTHSGEWAAMSAITVFESADHAYNLFTGTDVRYRGRKLAQAVKTLALRRARQFGVGKVRTNHNSENEIMIGIDDRLGYERTPGILVYEKELGRGEQ